VFYAFRLQLFLFSAHNLYSCHLMVCKMSFMPYYCLFT
jgi:hypothetical protein